MASPAPLTARISPTLVRQLDKVAAAKGVTRTELVRQGIELVIAQHEREQEDDASVVA